jgi:hypothetical protein
MKSYFREFCLKGFIAVICVCFPDQNISAQIPVPLSQLIIEYASTHSDTSKLNISTKSITLFAIEGSRAYVTIITGKSWYLKCSEEWLSTDIQSGTGSKRLVIKANENFGTSARSAYVTIYVNGLTPEIIDVFQKAKHEE